VFLVFALVAASPLRAQPAGGDDQPDADPQWAITAWGLSYHINRSVDYNESNWGLGLRYSRKPQWRWLGMNKDSRVFVEADALRNSNRGLVVPIAAGVQYRVAPIPGGCQFLAVGAVAFAYYRYPQRDLTDLKFGPVPGVAIRCGRVTTNMIAVLRKSSEPLAALTFSLTIGL
jgi:hypothetical protein